MKKLLYALICLVIIAAALSLQVSAIGEEIYAASGTPAIDGAADSIWSTTAREKFNYCVAGDLNDGKLPGSCSAYVSALYDEEALYFLIEVNDNDYIFGGEGEYGSDEIRIYIDEIDWFDTTWRYGQVCLIIMPDENGKVEVIGDVSDSTVVAYSKDNDTRRYVEVKYVPTKYDISEGKPLLVDFRFNDVYENSKGECAQSFCLTWSDELNEGDLDSSNWSYLKFGGLSAGDGYSDAEDAARSIGQPLITSYEFLEGSDGNPGEGSQRLFDCDIGSKFCTTVFPAKSVASLGGRYIITGVIMSTANDNDPYNGRCPDEWKIEGSNDRKNWTVIAEGDENFFEEVNYTYFAQKVESSGQGFAYIRFSNESSKSGTMQVGDLYVCGIKANSSKEEIDALLNPTETEPVAAENAIFLPISKSSHSDGMSTEAIAAPAEPGDTDGGFDSDAAVTVIVIAVSAALVIVCAVIAVVQSKQKRKNIL